MPKTAAAFIRIIRIIRIIRQATAVFTYPPHGLLFQRGVQGRVHEEYVVGDGEVDANGAGADTDEEHTHGVVLLEFGQGLRPLRSTHRTCEQGKRRGVYGFTQGKM